MIHRETVASALLSLHKVDEANAPAYANAIADVLISLTAPQLAEAKKQTALLEVLAKHADRASDVLRITGDTSGLSG